MDITFGPVPSRRLGRSLGINNIPPKICSYACVYCQLGKTIKMQIERQAFYRSEDILESVRDRVRQILKQQEKIDYLAFVPDGEPTLDINLGINIDAVKNLAIPVAVISNGSLISRPDVRSDLRKADWVSLKVDAVAEELWRAIDRPHGKLNLHQILDGMLVFRSEFKGTLVTETMLVKGMNDSVKSVHEIGQFLARLQPDIVYLSIPTRPPADKNIRRADPETINIAYQIMKSYVDKVELIIGYEGNAFSFTGDIRKDILNITSVHPMRLEAINAFLHQTIADWTIIEKMLENGELVQTEYQGQIFFMRSY